MCGICGVIDWTASGDAAGIVRRMTPTMRHRGPDDQGIADFEFRISEFGQRAKSEGQNDLGISDFEFRISESEKPHHRDTENTEDAQRRDSDPRNGALSIGMTRLSIIDIEGGHQPVFNEDGRIGGVLNGEIYNFQELRQQLEDCGHTFRTRSDSEVVVHAYEEWGEECVERFEGMFAIAVWDGRSSEFRVPSSELNAGEKRKTRSSEFRVPSSELNAGEGARAPGESDTLFLARDRLGIKPLYYFAQGAEFRGSSSKEEFRVPSSEFRVQTNIGVANSEVSGGLETRNSKLETFLFASEVRTLLASGAVPRRLSRAALESYLLFGSVSEPMTLIEGVLSIPPGHRMTIQLNNATAAIQPERYWHIAKRPSANGHGAIVEIRQAASRVRQLLAESVRKHLIADVPVGVFLSGGIDSTAIAALASHDAGSIHTFTVAFEEEKFSEAAVARRTAQRLGTSHDEMVLRGADMLARLDEAVAAMDQPSMDAINTYFVSWAARQKGLKVALSGLGGDEIFGGYDSTFDWTPRYRRLAKLGKRFPASFRSVMSAAVTSSGGHTSRGDAARKLAAIWNEPDSLPDPYHFARTVFPPPQLRELMTGRVKGATPWWNWLADGSIRASALDSFSAVTCMEAGCYLVNTLLRDTDFMSMAHSLEVRVPFLDHRLVEFVTHLPENVKRQHGTTKALLVAAVSDLLPAEIVNQSKRGFTIPLQQWLGGPLQAKVEHGLSNLSPSLATILNASSVRQVWESHLRGQTNWSRPWSLYVLNEWVKKHID